jgi:hypothetical protein
MGKNLVEFLKKKSFEEIRDTLSEPPYNLKIQEKGNLYLLKYDQINSDFSNPIVQECRGIILEKGTNEVICAPFVKFFNWGEGHAAKLDPKTTRFVEKMDGSLIKLYSYNCEWHVATNGMIDARDATVENITGKTFYDLWMEASKPYLDHTSWKYLSYVHPRSTWMFELVHPLSKIVKHYEPNIYFLGCRNNDNFKEWDDISTHFKDIPKPKTYSFTNLQEAIDVAQELPFDEEGYIAVDKDFNRVKVKSPAYVATAHMKSGLNSEKNILTILVKGEKDEVLALFPEFTDLVNEVDKKLAKFVEKVEKDWNNINDKEYESRKDFALEAVKTTVPGIMFSMKDKPRNTIKEAIFEDLTPSKLVKYIN